MNEAPVTTPPGSLLDALRTELENGSAYWNRLLEKDVLAALVDVAEAASDFELLYIVHDNTPPQREVFDRLMAAVEGLSRV